MRWNKRNDGVGAGGMGMMPNSGRRFKLIWVAVIVVVIGLVVAGVIFRDSIFPKGADQPTVAQPEDPVLARLLRPTTGETWLDSPKKMTAQGWLKLEDPAYLQNLYGTIDAEQYLRENLPTYVEVGARGDNSIILVNSPGEGVDGYLFLFERQPDGKVVAIARSQASAASSDWSDAVKESVSLRVSEVNEEIHYDSLDVPAKVAIRDGDYALRPQYLSIGLLENSLLRSSDKKTLVTKLGQASLYKIESSNVDTDLTNMGYYIGTPIGTLIKLEYEPNQLSLEGYSFNNGAVLQSNNVFDLLSPIAQGCGSSIGSVTRSDTIKDSDLEIVGKTNADRDVYDLTDKNHVLYQKAYEEYQTSNGEAAVSKADYISNHGLVLIKNLQGEILVYVREKYAPIYGCAKPVIYLYPEKATKVDVMVGADVTISDPLYPVGGWRNVWAEPNGQLAYQGAQYDSLFWEGTGFGRYPAITAGVVVKQVDAAATIRRQLAELGLNKKETQDFMDFWADRIPDAPYVRLTWFNTEELNRLAPLKITPKPDTLIRVFLDMSGLQKPVQLPAQRLTSVPRQGFTVVEWGGLTSQKLE